MSLNNNSIKQLLNNFGKCIRFDEPMYKHTSLRVGGPAKVYAEPESINDLVSILDLCRKKRLPYLIIGGGTNLLVKDNGIDAVVISITKCLKEITIKDKKNDKVIVYAGAGATMNSLCSFAIDQGLDGMNFAIGIPGTVGGGIMMNAGTAKGSVSDVLKGVTVLLPDGETKMLDRRFLNFEYRKLTVCASLNSTAKPICSPVILNGTFCLYSGDSEKLGREAEMILLIRKRKQPTSIPSAGCFFKNPRTGKSAGELIELAGLKGLSKGGAAVSPKHANFIINRDNASAADIIALSKLVQKEVLDKFNIALKPEVIIVGE